MIFKGHVADGIHLLIQPQPAVVIKESSCYIAEQQSDETTYTADDQALQYEYALNLLTLCAHRHQDRYVTLLLHHEHHENHENIQGGNQLDQGHGDDAHRFLQLQGV